MIRKLAIALTALLFVVAAWVFITRYPAPNMPARDTIGEKIILKNPATGLGDGEYYASGPAGPRAVLIASAGREVSDFNELVTHLNQKGFRTLSVQHGGIGATAPVYAADLNSAVFPIFKTLENDGYLKDDQPYFLIGHAYGNRVARVAGTYLGSPQTKKPLSAIILLAAGGNNEIPPKANAALKNAFNPLAARKQRMKDISYAFFADGNEIPDHWQRGWHRKTAILQGKAKIPKEGGLWESAGGVPMLVIQALEDRIAPKADTADILKAKYPDQVTVALIDKAGHALLPEQPDAIAAAVSDFLHLQLSE